MYTVACYAVLVLSLALTTRNVVGQREYGLCSQVFQMHQYCTSQVLGYTESPAKQGGAIGSQFGDDGTEKDINATFVVLEEKFKLKFEELAAEMREQFNSMQALINETMSSHIQDYEKTLEEIQSRIDRKLDSYEKIMNQTREVTKKDCRHRGLISTIKEHVQKSELRLNASIAELRGELLGDAPQDKKSPSRANPEDCRKVLEANAISWNGTGGVFSIYPSVLNESIDVYCDMSTDDGGWIVFQRRMDGSVNFFRNWSEYVEGFGESDKELWLGLETIYQLTREGDYELRIDMKDWHGRSAYAKYGVFSVGSSGEDYKLNVGEYIGNAGDSLAAEHNGKPFSARGKDLDGLEGSCAERYKGGWWYTDCYHSNLNGIYHKDGHYQARNSNGVVWYHWGKNPDYSLKFVEMKFRRKCKWTEVAGNE